MICGAPEYIKTTCRHREDCIQCLWALKTESPVQQAERLYQEICKATKMFTGLHNSHIEGTEQEVILRAEAIKMMLLMARNDVEMMINMWKKDEEEQPHENKPSIPKI